MEVRSVCVHICVSMHPDTHLKHKPKEDKSKKTRFRVLKLSSSKNFCPNQAHESTKDSTEH